MSKQYSPRAFFRQAPNRLLQRYFAARQILADLDFSTLPETQVEPIYEAWLQLSESVRNETEQDFQEIHDLASEGGSKAILDEAKWHGEDLTGIFSQLKGFQEHAFWTFLERKKYWDGAIAFNHADTVPSSYWRKRKNLPSKPASVDPDSVRQLERGLSGYFHKTQGRGQNCKVDCYKRNDLDYFFAYPEDYAQAIIEWEGKEFKRRPHHPAFEIIFVYSQKAGTLEVYLSGDRRPVPDLQVIFAEAILKAELGPDDKDERIYDLNPLRSRHFRFVYGPESGIVDVVVKKLRFKVHGKNEKITLEADASSNGHAVFDLLENVAKGISLAQVAINQVGIKVTFSQGPSSRQVNTRSFNITWPNSCSLKHDGRDLRIRKMLADSGIEPREPVTEDTAAA